MHRALVLAALASFTPCLRAQSSPPIALQFQARLADSTGAPITTSVALTARVYDVPVGGSAMWTQTFNVTPLNGVVTLSFDALGPILNILFEGGTRFLALQVNADAEMTPRRQIVSVPYARRAARAAALDANAAIPTGLITTTQILDGSIVAADLADATVTGAKIAAGTITAANFAPGAITAASIGPNSVNGAAILDGTITLADLANPLTASVVGPALNVLNAGIGGSAVHGEATASSGAGIGIFGEADSPNGFGVYGRAKAFGATAVYGEGGGNSTDGAAVKGVNNSGFPSGFSAGVRGEVQSTVSPQGVGVYATHAGRGNAVYATSGTGTAIYAITGASTVDVTAGIVAQTSSATNQSSGVRGRELASTGLNYGVWGETYSNIGWGVFGAAYNTAGGGNPVGVLGQSQSTTGIGVWGDSVPTSGVCMGVLGETSSTSGRGVLGKTVLTTGTSYGVRGENASVAGYAVYASGNLGCSGAKSFVQPHATDPSREVRFVCLEGNESGTYFRGTAQISGGVAVIDVPDEFRAVTEADALSCVATPVGAKASLWVESQDLNKVVVRGDADVKFHYVVNGVRRGFTDFQIVRENTEFVPEWRGVQYGTQYPEALRRVLVENGILNADFTPNEATAAKLGWTLREKKEDPHEITRAAMRAAGMDKVPAPDSVLPAAETAQEKP